MFSRRLLCPVPFIYSLFVFTSTVNGQPIDLLAVGAKDYASLPALPHVPPHLTQFQGALVEGLGADGMRIMEMTDLDDGTAEFPIELNLAAQLTRIASGRAESDRAVLYFAGPAHLSADELFLMAADSRTSAPSPRLALKEVLSQANLSLGRELLILDLVAAPGSAPAALATAAQAAMAGSNVPAIAIIWNSTPPPRPGWEAVLSLIPEALAGADLWGNNDGQNDSGEFASFLGSVLAAQTTSTDAAIIFASGSTGFQLSDSLATASLSDRKALATQLTAGAPGISSDEAQAALKLLTAIEADLAAGAVRAAITRGEELAPIREKLRSNTSVISQTEASRSLIAAAEKLALEVDLSAADPSGFAAANALLQSARALDRPDADPLAAASALQAAAERLTQVVLPVAKMRFQERTAQLPADEWPVYAPTASREVLAMGKKADSDAATGQSASAIGGYQSALAKIPTMQTEAINSLMNLAKPLMTKSGFSTAEVYLSRAVAMAPDRKALSDMLSIGRSTLKYDVGDSVTGPGTFLFAYTPPGSFMMGSPETEAGRDQDEVQRTVTITRGFFLGKTEVSWAQWRQVMGETLPTGAEDRGDDDIPVSGVSWDEATAFCERLTQQESGRRFRLPTEAEWEYACRAGTSTPYANGQDLLTIQEAAFYDPVSSLDNPTAVGTVGSPNPWGLMDMHGNLWEWCQDWSAPYDPTNTLDPKGPVERPAAVDASPKVARGGSWFDGPTFARSANRGEFMPVVGNGIIGFRVLLEADFPNP